MATILPSQPGSDLVDLGDISNHVLMLTRVQCISQDARDELSGTLNDEIEQSLASDSSLVRCAVCTVADPKNTTDLYVIEEYDSNDYTPGTTPLQTIIANSPDLTQSPPSTQAQQYTPSTFEKTSLSPSRTPSPYPIYATINFTNTSSVQEIRPYGTKVVVYARDNEAGCLFYGDTLAVDPVSDTFIGALEVYRDEAAFGVHAQGQALQSMIGECQKLGGKLVVIPLVLQYGFLTRL